MKSAKISYDLLDLNTHPDPLPPVETLAKVKVLKSTAFQVTFG